MRSLIYLLLCVVELPRVVGLPGVMELPRVVGLPRVTLEVTTEASQQSASREVT